MRSTLAAVVPLALLALAGCSNSSEAAPPPATEWHAPIPQTVDVFTAAQDTCGAFGEGLTVGDNGQTLVVDIRYPGFGMGQEQLTCVHSVLGTPLAVQEKMAHTRAWDGRQEGSWPGFEASWTFHPDSGINMIVTVAGSPD